mmetsp:Transcript_19258/g.42580  ORF Transcript_19258/g.42580 Transcript_19258/m.42580 type:complete len:266 (-) Transcript_19258:92-889(-)
MVPLHSRPARRSSLHNHSFPAPILVLPLPVRPSLHPDPCLQQCGGQHITTDCNLLGGSPLVARRAEVIITGRTSMHPVAVGNGLRALVAGVAPRPWWLGEGDQLVISWAGHGLCNGESQVVAGLLTDTTVEVLARMVIPHHLHPPTLVARAFDGAPAGPVLQAPFPIGPSNHPGSCGGIVSGDLRARSWSLPAIQSVHKLLIRRHHLKVVGPLLAGTIDVGVRGAVPLHSGPPGGIGTDDDSLPATVLVVPFPVGPALDTDAFTN